MGDKTSITVEKETHKRLSILKIEMEYSSFDEMLADMAEDYE